MIFIMRSVEDCHGESLMIPVEESFLGYLQTQNEKN